MTQRTIIVAAVLAALLSAGVAGAANKAKPPTTQTVLMQPINPRVAKFLGHSLKVATITSPEMKRPRYLLVEGKGKLFDEKSRVIGQLTHRFAQRWLSTRDPGKLETGALKRSVKRLVNGTLTHWGGLQGGATSFSNLFDLVYGGI